MWILYVCLRLDYVQYPKDNWLHIYTEGSANPNRRNKLFIIFLFSTLESCGILSILSVVSCRSWTLSVTSAKMLILLPRHAVIPPNSSPTLTNLRYPVIYKFLWSLLLIDINYRPCCLHCFQLLLPVLSSNTLFSQDVFSTILRY